MVMSVNKKAESTVVEKLHSSLYLKKQRYAVFLSAFLSFLILLACFFILDFLALISFLILVTFFDALAISLSPWRNNAVLHQYVITQIYMLIFRFVLVHKTPNKFP